MYSYISCRPDIGYSVTTLSKFSYAPTAYHYKLLKGSAKYLKSTNNVATVVATFLISNSS